MSIDIGDLPDIPVVERITRRTELFSDPEIRAAILEDARDELEAIQIREYEPESSAERAGLNARIDELYQIIGSYS